MKRLSKILIDMCLNTSRYTASTTVQSKKILFALNVLIDMIVALPSPSFAYNDETIFFTILSFLLITKENYKISEQILFRLSKSNLASSSAFGVLLSGSESLGLELQKISGSHDNQKFDEQLKDLQERFIALVASKLSF